MRGAYLPPMRIPQIIVAASLVIATPAFAQDGEGEGDPLFPSDEEWRALGDYAEEMMRKFAERVDPMIERLRVLIDDIGAYEAPERLPNGDIIIRRKPDAPPPGPADPPAADPPESGPPAFDPDMLDPDEGMAL